MCLAGDQRKEGPHVVYTHVLLRCDQRNNNIASLGGCKEDERNEKKRKDERQKLVLKGVDR